MTAHQPQPAFALAVHGGAGTILRINMTAEREQAYRDGITGALAAGYDVLAAEGSSLDAVQAAVNAMENSPLFNAGKGAVFTHDGAHEQDACIMDGASLEVGAVAMVRRIRNPIDLARLVMERSSHVLLAGDGAEAFAEAQGMALENDQAYFDTEFRRQQLQKAIKREKTDCSGAEHTRLDHSDDKIGTVGAVALDCHGNLAAATSTGGMTNKRYGRIGDSPIIGAGTYADNDTCAVSATGVGEFMMRGVVAYDIAAMMRYKEMSLAEAADEVVIEKLVALGGDGGVIAIDRAGNIAMPFNSKGMYRGYSLPDADPVVAIYGD